MEYKLPSDRLTFTVQTAVRAERPWMRLWKECFDEEPPELVMPLRESRRQLLMMDGDRAAAMVNLLPLRRDEGTAQLYAVCTAPEYRGRGLASFLVKKARELAELEGVRHLYLSPASPKLAEWYGRLGFTPCAWMREEPLRREAVPEGVELVYFNPGQYMFERRAFVPDNALGMDWAWFEYQHRLLLESITGQKDVRGTIGGVVGIFRGVEGLGVLAYDNERIMEYLCPSLPVEAVACLIRARITSVCRYGEGDVHLMAAEDHPREVYLPFVGA